MLTSHVDLDGALHENMIALEGEEVPESDDEEEDEKEEEKKKGAGKKEEESNAAGGAAIAAGAAAGAAAAVGKGKEPMAGTSAAGTSSRGGLGGKGFDAASGGSSSGGSTGAGKADTSSSGQGSRPGSHGALSALGGPVASNSSVREHGPYVRGVSPGLASAFAPSVQSGRFSRETIKESSRRLSDGHDSGDEHGGGRSGPPSRKPSALRQAPELVTGTPGEFSDARSSEEPSPRGPDSAAPSPPPPQEMARGSGLGLHAVLNRARAAELEAEAAEGTGSGAGPVAEAFGFGRRKERVKPDGFGPPGGVAAGGGVLGAAVAGQELVMVANATAASTTLNRVASAVAAGAAAAVTDSEQQPGGNDDATNRGKMLKQIIVLCKKAFKHVEHLTTYAKKLEEMVKKVIDGGELKIMCVAGGCRFMVESVRFSSDAVMTALTQLRHARPIFPPDLGSVSPSAPAGWTSPRLSPLSALCSPYPGAPARCCRIHRIPCVHDARASVSIRDAKRPPSARIAE